MKRRALSKKSGVTLVETVVAAGISSVVMFSALSVHIAGASSWVSGEQKIDAESKGSMVVRKISDELKEAMIVKIDSDGNGLTFEKPQADANGDFVINVFGHPVSDGVERRFYVSSGKMFMDDGVNEPRALCDGVVLKDPKSPGGTTTYKPFVGNTGSITRQVTVLIVTEGQDANGEKVHGRRRETVFLRNIIE